VIERGAAATLVAVGDVTEAVVSVTSATQLADLIEHCCGDHPGWNYADGGAPMGLRIHVLAAAALAKYLRCDRTK
jgi:hypothetical protein